MYRPYNKFQFPFETENIPCPSLVQNYKDPRDLNENSGAEKFDTRSHFCWTWVHGVYLFEDDLPPRAPLANTE